MNGQPKALSEYDPQKFNVLRPTTESRQITPWHKAEITAVRIDPNPDHGQVYSQSGGLALTKLGLYRLAQAAGMQFGTPTLKAEEDGSITASVMARITGSDGREYEIPGTYTWDVPARIEDAQIAAKKKGKAVTPQEMINIRKYATMRAETGAIERAIRSTLSLQGVYKKTDLAKPFVVARVSYNPMDDPMYRVLLAAKAAGVTFTGEALVALLQSIQRPVEGPAQLPAGEEQQALPAQALEEVPDNHWVRDGEQRGAFWLKTEDKGLTQAEVYAANEVPSMLYFHGTEEEALANCDAYVAAQLPPY